MGVLSKAAINRAFAPLSHALLREGRTNVEAEIAGFKVIACRQSNLHVRFGGCGGFAWNPHYRVIGDVEWNGRTIGVRSGTRDEMAAWLHRHQREAEPCPHCDGAGERFDHADDCVEDSCALNGDIDSCNGQVVTCHCVAALSRATGASG